MRYFFVVYLSQDQEETMQTVMPHQYHLLERNKPQLDKEMPRRPNNRQHRLHHPDNHHQVSPHEYYMV